MSGFVNILLKIELKQPSICLECSVGFVNFSSNAYFYLTSFVNIRSMHSFHTILC